MIEVEPGVGLWWCSASVVKVAELFTRKRRASEQPVPTGAMGSSGVWPPLQAEMLCVVAAGGSVRAWSTWDLEQGTGDQVSQGLTPVVWARDWVLMPSTADIVMQVATFL